MGIGSFFKRLFTGEAEEDPELEAARARHNIVVEDDKKRDRGYKDAEREAYDPWEEVDNLRRNFFLGSWASRKLNWRPNTDKLKAELEAIERKRREKEAGEKHPGEGGQP